MIGKRTRDAAGRDGLTVAEARAAAVAALQAQGETLKALLGLPPDATPNLRHLVAVMPTAVSTLERSWVAQGAPPPVASGCAQALLEAIARHRCSAPVVRLLSAGGPAALMSALEWLTPLEASAAVISAAALGSPGAPGLLQALLPQALRVLPRDDASADAAAAAGAPALPSQRRLAAAALWTAVYNDRGPAVGLLWPLIAGSPAPGAPPSAGRAAIAVAAAVGSVGALGALLAVVPPLGDWSRCLVELALRVSTWPGAPRAQAGGARAACLRAMAASGRVDVAEGDLREAVADAQGRGLLSGDEAAGVLAAWQARGAAAAAAAAVAGAAATAAAGAAPMADAWPSQQAAPQAVVVAGMVPVSACGSAAPWVVPGAPDPSQDSGALSLGLNNAGGAWPGPPAAAAMPALQAQALAAAAAAAQLQQQLAAMSQQGAALMQHHAAFAAATAGAPAPLVVQAGESSYGDAPCGGTASNN
ncbi:MAG: hypothetical protein J3K34DRAFT_526026 [Monoraphidium minutum]|nr:MAG: hypothetical protein J3K34DRAFT_526026 [Monoraphidium minutum]